MKKTWKKLIVGIFAFALILSGMSLISIDGSIVNAAETNAEYYVQSYTGEEVSAYKTADTAPVPTPAEGSEEYNDWIFAGWFTNEACSSVLGETIDTTATYYAKYVPAEVLSVKAQVKEGTDPELSTSTDMRLVATVDSLSYKSVGFEVYYNGSAKPVTIKTTTVYSRIEAAKDGVEYGFSPNIFDVQSEYFVTATLKNIANKNFDKGFYIRPYWVTLDGTTSYGVSRYARVEDSYLNIVNVPVRVVSDATTATTGTINVAYDTTYFSYADTYASTLADGTATSTSGYANGRVFDSVTVDGTTTAGTVAIAGTAEAAQKVNGEVAHLRLQVKTGVTLPKKNVFTVTSSDLTTDIVVADTVYNYFRIASAYNSTLGPDTSWYDENETEFVITTPEELYGVAKKVNTDTVDFTGKTIYLGSSIALNTGTPEGDDGVWGTGDDDWSTVAPTNNWTPIGAYKVATFSGTFDGQGHTLSGVYSVPGTHGVGLFGQIADGSVIRNFKITDSYFSGKSGVGSVCGWYAGGTIDTIYSDAYVNSTADHAGGIVALLSPGSTLKNCWYAGTVTSTEDFIGGLVSFVGSSDITVESCLNSGSISGKSQVGGIVGRVTSDFTFKDCLNVGTFATNNAASANKGALLGTVIDVAVTGDRVYALGSTTKLYNGTDSTGTSGDTDTIIGSFTGGVGIDELTGMDGYTNTELDFENYWVIRETDTPVLKTWVESGALYVPDTEWAGSGTEEDPWIIKTASELYGLAYSVNTDAEVNGYADKYFKLGANITVNSGTASKWVDEAPKYNWNPIGTSANPFKGHFNTTGSIYAIKGLYATGSEDTSRPTWYVGLFGYAKDAEIKNVKVMNSYLQAAYYAGAVAGTSDNSTIDTVYSNSVIKATSGNSAGVVGSLNGGTISRAWFDGSITNPGQYTGGIAGVTQGGAVINNCLSTGSVISTKASGNLYVGGIFGGATGTTTASDCLSAVKELSANVTNAAGTVAGGIGVKGVSATVTNSYAVEGIFSSTHGTGNGAISAEITEVADLIGANGYMNTYLTFDRHEEHLPASEQHDGVWVTRTGDVPGLKSFVDTDDRLELVKQDTYRRDTRWYNDTDTTFTINNAEELVGFMDIVNSGTSFTGKTVQLGTDIAINAGKASDWYAGSGEAKLYNWIPIGNGDSIKFSGTFDGKGHTITGIYAEHSANGIGLFGRIADGSVVRDFKITNSYISGKSGVSPVCGWWAGGSFDTIYSDAYVVASANHAAGILALPNAGTTVKNCWYKGVLRSTASFVGGITSYLGGANITVEACLNSGDIQALSEIGGIVGRVAMGTNTGTIIKDCLNVGTISTTKGSQRKGAIIGWPYSGTVTCENAYALGASAVLYPTVASGTTAPGSVTGTLFGVDDLTGGNAFLNTWLTFDRPELAEPTTGYWVAVADSTPVLKSFLGDAERVSLDGEYLYRADTRWYDAETTSYIIDTAEELIGFASLVNGGTSFADKAVQLGADIVVNTGNAKDWANGTNTENLYPWAPIGTTTYPFDGKFNTDNDIYEISGLYATSSKSTKSTWYVGLFGYVNGAEVKNVKVANSYIEAAYYAGAIVGTSEASIVDTVYTNAIVKATAGNSAGVVGSMVGGTLSKAWFDGSITNPGQYTGGVVGVSQGEAIISNCLATGSVTSTTSKSNAYAGGIVGGATGTTTVSDCLSALEVFSVKTSTASGSVAGGIGLSGVTASVTNSYAVEEIYTKTHGTGNGTFTATVTAVDDLTNYKGYMNTSLDFDNTWVAMEESTPRLQSFAPTDGRFDTTSWFTKAVADGEDNAAGTEANPYIIDSLADLYGFTKRVKDGNTFENQYIKLTKSITANTVDDDMTVAGWATEAPYYVWTPIGTSSVYFKGHFDGGKNTISGLYEKRAETEKDKSLWYVGLFGFANGATIQNVNVNDSYFFASYYAAPIVGWMTGGTIDSVSSNATIQVGSGHGGGIAGAIESATIQNSWFKGSVTGPSYVGGMVGFATNIDNAIYHCLSTGTLHASNKQVGGIVGRVASNTIIEDCLSTSTVTSVSGNRGSVVGYVASGSLTMTSVYGYSESGVTNGATAISGGKATGLTVSGGTAIADLHAVYDTETYDKLDSAYWTARVGAVPIPTVFAIAGNYATVAKVGSTYAINTNLTGSGDSESDPILITSAEDLYGFALLSQKDSYAGKFIKLADNITVNTATINKDDTEAVYYDWYPIGNASVPFAGTFLGNGKTISGLYKSYDNFDHWIGLFDTTADTSKLSNFRITNTFFLYEGTKADPTRMGSVAGEAYGTIENIYSDATLQSFGRGTGGIIGTSASGGTSVTITNCWYDGTIISTKNGSSPYMGGIVGIEGNANATISHCLVSGDVLGLDKRVGGLVGSVNNGTLTMTDCLFSGDITGGYTVNTGDYAGYEYVGQLIGAVEASSTGTTVTVNSSYGVNDYAPYDIGTKVVYNVTETTENEDGTTTTTVVDTIHPTVNGRGYVSKQYDRLIGYAGTTASLDYTNYWALAKEGTPILKYFADSADIYDGSQIDALLELDYWNSTNVALSKAEEKGQGTYMLTISGSSLTAYNEYLAALDAGIFDAYSNDQSSDLNTEGVYNAIYTSANCGDSTNDDWIINVTYVDGTIYISIATGQPLSQHLKADSIVPYTTEGNEVDDGYTDSGLTPTFHMLEEKYYSASSYVIQLSNGHLIVIDGGINSEAPYLFEYMQSLVPEGKKPIIEAWVLSHGHYDHVGTMMGFVQNASTYADKVYLEGIYYNEASEVVLADYASADDPHHQYMGYIEKITSVFKTTKDKEADIYRMYTGQRYTFDGVTMDIMLSQELITADNYTSTASNGAGDVFNETSTWNLFTINGKKLLTMGDASEASKARIVDMYSTIYLTVDVFTAMHHGKNINRLSSILLGYPNDSFSKALTVNSVVLYPFAEDLTVQSDRVGEYVAGRNKTFLEEMISLGVATTYADGSTGTAKYFYYGQGTSVLTFGDTITAKVLAHNDWDVTN